MGPETASPAQTPQASAPEAKKKPAQKKPKKASAKAETTETETKAEQSETPETRTEKQIEEKKERSAAPKGRDFTFPEGGLQLHNGAKSRAKANLDAIRILRTLESEGRPATAEEQDALSKFVGWGGLSDIFDKNKSEWETLRGQLKTLLSDEEYAAAERSTMNAHYTSAEVIKGVYAALEHIGFTGGRVLEPSAGIGHFNGAMPANLRGKSRFTMVELDPITGGIAKALYPNADVRVTGFENALLPDNYYDAAISNVPFGDLRVVDKNYPNFITHSIHNYFFAKALDKVRPGGIVAFITSRYTMDARESSVRKYISARADLLGAVRLPDTAFKSNAGTDVVTDILILRKREPGKPYAGEAFIGADYQSVHTSDGYGAGFLNEYFKHHPEMVLGDAARGSMYHGDGLTWKPKGTSKSLTEQIIEAFSTVTEKMSYPVRRTQEDIRAEIRADAAKGKQGGLVKRDGKIYRNADGKLVEATDIPKTQIAKTEAVIAMRDGARALMDFQASGAPQTQIDASRKGLNAMYDDFLKRYGPLHENRSVIMRDTDGPFIMSLEKYDKDTKTATKADIFKKNTIAPNVTATHADSVEDALTISLNETGAVSAERIAELTGDAPESVTKTLLESGLAFLNRDGNLETAEQYLSGNVRAKLTDAKALAEGNPEYRRNVEALEKIIPADIEAENIKVQIGATWVPDEIYAAFAEEMTRQSGHFRVTYNHALGEYRVEPSRNAKQALKMSALNTTKWGTKDKTFVEIFAATLNNKDLNVWRKRGDGSRILDTDATEAAKQKAKEIQAEFQDWLFRKPERREILARLYNDLFNNSVTPRYDGSKLEISGMNTGITLNPHQKNAIWRIINSGGNTLLAHRVGAGKTYEMAAAAMKLRQLGIVKKPMFVVPKALTGQWAREFFDLFSNAKVLAPGDDFSAANRKEYVNRIATGDYDAVILSYEQFKTIPMSAESRAGFIKEQIDQLAAALEEEANSKNGRSPSVKQMAKKKANLEAELKKLMDKKEDADNINFEALGVDSLFVDEAHNMKNLFYTTHMNNITGMGNKEGSQQAFDLYMKTRYLQRLNGGRGIVFATATPVMNSVVEMYTMQNYLQPDALAARGIHNFDAWANQFAEVRTELQISPSGQGGRLKDTLSRYNNLQALQQMFSQFMDVVTDIPGLKIPKMEGGKRIVVECEASERQQEEMRVLARRAEDIKNRKVDPKVDNILKIGTDGRKLSYSQHMIDPSLPYEPDGKIMKCAENVFQRWKNSADIRGTQIIFCDYFTPKSSGSASAKGAEAELVQAEAALDAQAQAEAITLYEDLKNILVGMGIPAKQIAFIHDAKSVEQRNQLFDKVRAGSVRVLLGSTGKMGVGMNAQNLVVAEHHLDAPQRPGDIEQREGRALRQGNVNDEVAVYVYITKNTFDARSWDILQRKWTFIVQLMSGDFTGNSFEGDSDVLSAAEIKALASGNPLIQEQFQLTSEIASLEGLERAHRRETFAAQDKLKAAKAAIAADTDTAARLRADIATRRDTSGKAFAITLDGKSVTERKAAGEQLIKLAQKFLKPGQGPETTKRIGTFAGFDLLTTSGGDLILRGRGQYRATVNFKSAAGTVQTLEAAVKKLDSTLSAVESRLKANKNSVPELERASTAPFAQAAELERKRRRQAEILAELSDERKPSGDAESASGTPEAATPETSAFRDTVPAWEVTDDGSGVLKFRDTSAAKDTKSGDAGKSAKAATMGSHPERWTAERVGDADVTPGRIAEIIRKYSQGWSRHVTTGHVRGARGQYQRQGTGIGSGGIRLKQANDLPVFIHELGHAITDGYQLVENLRNPTGGMSETVRLSKEGQNTVRARLKIRQELIDNLDPQFAAQYDNDQLPDEGMAEFFRRFCQNRVQTAAEYPETYRYVMTTLSGADQARLLAMADEVNAVYALDTETAQSSVRRMDEKVPDYRGRRERFSNVIDSIIQKTVDSLYPVKKLSQMMGSKVSDKFYNAAYADSMAHFILTNDLRDLDGQYKGPGLRTVLSRINVNDEKEFNAFGEYLIVRNAPSWIADDKRVLANDRKNNLLYCELREKELEQQYPQFKAASEALYEFWDSFMKIYVVETGLISQEQYDAMRAKHPYYVPFRRVMDDVIAASKGFGTHRPFANQPNPIKKAKGSGRDIIHPIESMINSVAKFVYQGVHQRCMLELIDTADAYGLDAAFMERVHAPVFKQTANIAGIKAEIAERVTNSDLPEKDVELLLNILEEQGDMMSWYVPRQLLPENCIGVRRNGEVEVYKINDPLLFDALANMGRPQLHELLQPINKVTRAVSSLITGYNITWNLFSNAPRDIQTALISTKSGHRAELLLKTVNSYLLAAEKARNAPNINPYYMEYLALGGGGSSAWAMDTKLPKKVLSEIQPRKRAWNPISLLLQASELLSRTVEGGPRAATYIMGRESGMNPQAAFRAAMESTVDFRKGGKVSRAINAFMPFFNAGVQGMMKDMDMLIHAGKAGLITYLVASLIGAAIEYALNGMTDERRKSYSRLSTYTKNSYYCIPIGDGKYFGIPKARGMLIPENFFRALMERTIGGNRHAYDGFWGYAATAEFPNALSDVITLNPSSFFGSVTILGPMAQIWANSDFRGMPIESARDRRLSPRERYTGSTSLLAKSVGDALNLSPKQIDFLGNNTLGALWQYQSALFPVDASKRDLTLGVQGKYVKDSLYSQDSVNRLYDLAEKSSRDSMDDITDTDSKVTAYFDSAMT
ncbi:MAG: DEAD/DEAH box helicase family protein, partial [Oscillibacter sp.]|nr:DEAD/DEAH box helicase family protein [Oscillibacter sp.]